MRKLLGFFVICIAFLLCCASRTQQASELHRYRRMALKKTESVESKFKSVESILQELAKGAPNLIGEYEDISKRYISGTFKAGNRPENRDKNRYIKFEMFANDENRVILKHDEKNTSDYINANFVDGFEQKKEFIMTQG